MVHCRYKHTHTNTQAILLNDLCQHVLYLPLLYTNCHVCSVLHFQCWDWTDRCSDHYGNGTDSVGRQSAGVPAGNCQNTQRSASHDGSDHGTKKQNKETSSCSSCSLLYFIPLWLDDFYCVHFSKYLEADSRTNFFFITGLSWFSCLHAI